MTRVFNIILFTLFFIGCSGDMERASVHSFESGLPNVALGRENRVFKVDDFFSTYYNIELLEVDTLHPVMQITCMSRRPSGDNYQWVNAVLRMDITIEQRTQLQELLREVAFSPRH